MTFLLRLVWKGTLVIKWTETKCETCLTPPKHKLSKQMNVNNESNLVLFPMWVFPQRRAVSTPPGLHGLCDQRREIFTGSWGLQFGSWCFFFHTATTRSKRDLGPTSVLWSMRFFGKCLKRCCDPVTRFLWRYSLDCCPQWWQTAMEVMESGLLQHQFPFKCLPGFRSAFSTVCVRLPGIVPLTKAQRLILPSNFFEKEMSRLRVRFEFMSRFNVFRLFLDGASHHQQRTPQAVCWCSLWQQQNMEEDQVTPRHGMGCQ